MSKFIDRLLVSTPKKNKIDLSHERKAGMNAGRLYPCLVQEVVPGDSFRLTTEIFGRLAPMIAPPMHRVNINTYFHFVPTRLVWDETEKFWTGGADGLQAPVVPYFVGPDTTQFKTGSLFDHMGCPPYDGGGAPAGTMQFCALPFRAYQTVWNEWFRDQDLSTDLALSKASGQVLGAELAKILALRDKCWEKDYFTTARPWAQKGTASGVSITPGTGNPMLLKNSATNANLINQTSLQSNALANLVAQPANVTARLEDPNSKVLITDLRKANRLQEFLEKMGIGGSRYIEYLKHIWNVRSSDARLQRSEYLGGGQSYVQMSEVLSSVLFDDGVTELPQGNLAGRGVVAGAHHGFTRTFEEHGYIIGTVCIQPRTAYTGGVDRMYANRKTRFDFYTPDFANIGEQVVSNWEVGVDYNAPIVEGTFGYQTRYGEYKWKNSSSHGSFRNSLSYWTYDRIFSAAPALNENFVKCVPTKRMFAVNSEAVDSYFIQMFHKLEALRPIPYYNSPGHV